ncbi:MAG: DUF2125 domain-containing protein [Pseudomonadota bacterium]
MNKTVKIIGGVLVVAALGWTGLWFWVKGQIETRMDAEIAQIARGGDKISFAERSVAGFPFTHRTVLTDVVGEMADGQIIYKAPDLVIDWNLQERDQVTVTLPATFTGEFVPPEDLRESSPDLPERMVFDFETVDTKIVAEGPPGVARQLQMTGESIVMVHSFAATDAHFAIEFQKIDTNATIPADPEVGEVISAGTLELIDYALSMVGEDGRRVTMEGQVEDVQITGTSNIRQPAHLEAMMAGDLAYALSATYNMGNAITRIRVDGDEENQGGTLTSTTGTSAAVMELANGTLDLRGEARTNAWEVTPDDEAVPYRGTVAIDMIDLIYKVPFAPSEEMLPFDVKLAMIGFQPDEVLWTAFDKDAVLARDPAEMTVDFEGTMRLTKQQGEVRPGEAPPVAFGNLIINRIDLAALGATAKATGDVEFIQPLNLPQGRVKVTLTQVMETLTKLVEAKIVTPDFLLVGSLMAQNYLVEDPETGAMIADIEMGPTGYTINGQPLQ